MEGRDYKVTNSGQQKAKKVGHSKFYDVSSCINGTEKQDVMKPDDFIEEGR